MWFHLLLASWELLLYHKHDRPSLVKLLQINHSSLVVFNYSFNGLLWLFLPLCYYIGLRNERDRLCNERCRFSFVYRITSYNQMHIDWTEGCYVFPNKRDIRGLGIMDLNRPPDDYIFFLRLRHIWNLLDSSRFNGSNPVSSNSHLFYCHNSAFYSRAWIHGRFKHDYRQFDRS